MIDDCYCACDCSCGNCKYHDDPNSECCQCTECYCPIAIDARTNKALFYQLFPEHVIQPVVPDN